MLHAIGPRRCRYHSGDFTKDNFSPFEGLISILSPGLALDENALPTHTSKHDADVRLCWLRCRACETRNAETSMIVNLSRDLVTEKRDILSRC